MAKEMMKETGNSLSKGVAAIKADMDPIREDIETLKQDARVLRDDAVVLGRDLRVEGKKQLSKAEDRAKEALVDAKERGRESFAEVIDFVQKNPGQSLAVAFVGGMIASMLLGRRG